MQAEIISCGDELVSGKILDTNARWLSQKLIEQGVTPLYHTTIGDDLRAMVDVLRIASNRADLILWTGGLGPTADDLTRQAIAELAGVELVKNESSMAHIQAVFQRLGREMPKANETQAYQPKGADAIFNPHGTAPGIDMTIKRQDAVPEGRFDCYRVLAYPGVPAEMREMWFDSGEKTICAWLNRIAGQRRVLRFRSINCFGLGESQVEALLPDIINRNHFPKVGITATQATITLRIAAEAATEQECLRIMEPTARLIYDMLGDMVFSEGDDTLADVVCRKLEEARKTVAAVEIGTRGLLAEALARSAVKLQEYGLHQYGLNCFSGGIVLPRKQNADMEELFRQGRQLVDADYLLLVGAFPVHALSAGQTECGRRDTVCVAVMDGRQNDFSEAVLAQEDYPYAGHPDIIADLFVKRTLDLLRKLLTRAAVSSASGIEG